MTAGKRIGVRAYARHRADRGLPGATHTAVRKAIESGRIAEAVTFNARGWAQIDPDVADEEWSSATDPAQQRAPEAPPAPAATEKTLFGEVPKDAPPGAGNGAEGRVAYQRAQALHKTFQAQLARLEYEERAGVSLNAETVRRTQFEFARAVRDALLRLPDRCADELADLDDAHDVRQVLDREIRDVLLTLAKAEDPAS